MSSYHDFSRRRVLRGLLGGSAVSVGLPLLDCYLNSNGNAFASGEALPVCFGTWFYGLGMNPGLWEPTKIGDKYDMRSCMAVLQPHRDQINVISGLTAHLEGGNPHATGARVVTTGETTPPSGAVAGLPSIDTLISDVIGKQTRFRSLEVACDGSARTSISQRSGSSINPAEVSPAAFYTRIFGPDFTDPNAADFKPDPRTMVEQSALSAVADQRRQFAKNLGAADRARLDEYFTSLRSVEKQLAIQLQKPAPMAACTIPAKGSDAEVGTDVTNAVANHKLFSALIAHALACGQTQVFNMAISGAASNLRRAGNTSTHHILSHEEVVDPVTGYQPNVTWFQERYMEAFRDLLVTLGSIREGDKTLLDRTLVYAMTDVSYGRNHSTKNFPVFTAGSAGGRVKTGLHIAGNGDTICRAGLTVQQIMGVRTGTWGTTLNQTSKPLSEMIA